MRNVNLWRSLDDASQACRSLEQVCCVPAMNGSGMGGQQAQLQAEQSRAAVATDSDEEEGDGIYSEEDVVLIMEFASLGRAAAIELLHDFGGDTESVLANIFP